MPADLAALLNDLAAEQRELDAIVAPLDVDELALPTPSEPWSVRDQVTHLGWYDRRATQAVTDPTGFARHLEAAAADPTEVMEGHLRSTDSLTPAELLAWWRAGRDRLHDALAGADPTARVPWYGPPMSLASMVTARLMETWCHGQDIVDALGVERTPTARLRHVAHIAVRARAFSFAAHGRPAPSEDVRVEVRAPDGGMWTWGAPDAAGGRVRSTALDLALLACQRRHRDDVAVEAHGPVAAAWLEVIQAYAGPPGPGRPAGAFVRGARG